MNDMDPDSAEWIASLRSEGRKRDRAHRRLHDLCVRAARTEVNRRRGRIRIAGPELEDLAEQAAADAMVAVIAKLETFRGESRFTTWAYRFVVFEVSTKIGRHFWQRRPAVMDSEAWERLPDILTPSPELQAEQRELLELLRAAIDGELTELQRRVFVAVALNQVPMDAFARELGATRNAVYKTLFDARRKLRVCLAAAGHARPASPIRAS